MEFLEQENDLEIDEVLAKLTQKIENEREKQKTIRVGINQFPFLDKDPIFLIGGPIQKKNRSGNCTSCKSFVFESESQMKFCEFCGWSNCEKCLQKERMYPRGRIDAEGKKPKGLCCKLCDRKFLMRQVTLDSMVNI